MNPPTTPTVMPLEETEMYLHQMLQYDPVDAPGAFSVGGDAAAKRQWIIRSALHHLEAGKRDAERYQSLRALAEEEGIEITWRDFRGQEFGGFFEEGADLDEAIDCLSTQTQEKGQG